LLAGYHPTFQALGATLYTLLLAAHPYGGATPRVRVRVRNRVRVRVRDRVRVRVMLRVMPNPPP